MKRYFSLILLLFVFLVGCEQDSQVTDEPIEKIDSFTWLVFDTWSYEVKTLSLDWEDLLVRAFENIVYESINKFNIKFLNSIMSKKIY